MTRDLRSAKVASRGLGVVIDGIRVGAALEEDAEAAAEADEWPEEAAEFELVGAG